LLVNSIKLAKQTKNVFLVAASHNTLGALRASAIVGHATSPITQNIESIIAQNSSKKPQLKPMQKADILTKFDVTKTNVAIERLPKVTENLRHRLSPPLERHLN
jgi:hypothetical protein